MYSSIANTTFSYLLTLDKFRNTLPPEHRPSWVKVTTITMVSKELFKDININTLRSRLEQLGPIKVKRSGSSFEGFEWHYRPSTKFYNQITLRYVDSYSTKSVKVFPNGSIQVAGCSDLFDCNRIIQQLSFLLKTILNINHDIPTNSFRVVMINTNFSLNYNINLHELYIHFISNKLFNVSFEPDRYSAVKIKFKPAADMKQVTVSIFSTGKIIVTGAETLREIAYAYNVINHHILINMDKIKVSKTAEIETFGIFSGFKIEELILKFTELGFRPWEFLTSNRQINF
jgi:TATA-box binding protein (TBP) (component of TFIID and TFIIIB)